MPPSGPDRPRTKSRHGLRQRLLRQFTLLTLLPLLAVMAVAAMVLLPTLMRSADERNFELATAIRDQVQQRLQQRERLVFRLAGDLKSQALPGDAIVRELHELIDTDPLLRAAYVADVNGAIAHAALDPRDRLHQPDMLMLDPSMQPHLREALDSQHPVWSETYLSPVTGRLTASLAVPIGPQALVVELALDDLSSTLAEIGRSSRTRAIIVDRQGRIVGHPDPERALRHERLTDLPLIERALHGQPGTDRIRNDGVDHLAHALPVQPLGWAILVMRPVGIVLAPLITLGQLLAATIVATIALSLLLVRLLARRTGQEVERLAEAAEAAATAGPAAAALDFTITEFHALWQRLRSLFAELHERDRQTESARRDLQAVLDAATEVAIVATDTAGRVTVFSAGAQKMLAHRAVDVVGRATPVLWHDEQEVAQRGAELSRRFGRAIDGFEALVCQARHAGYEVRDWTYVRADGRRVDVSLAVTAMHAADGALHGFLGVAIDISERRRADAMEVARRAAEQANQAKTEFLSRMSHELRTPLNAVLGYAQLMEMSTAEPPTPGQLRQLQQIQRSGWHLVQLIDDVLDLARIEAGTARVAIEDIDAMRAIERAQAIVAPLMTQRGVALTLDVDAGVGAYAVRADTTRLVQVLVNLLSNAAKYNRPGGRVVLRLVVARDQQLQFIVRDTGIGMDERQIAQLYQPFNRLGRESGPVPGSGIGLVVVKRNVDLMGGRIEVESQPGVGTTFSVTLPASATTGIPADAPPSPALPPAPTPAPAPAPVARVDDGAVLCIEDNADNARLIRELLRQRPTLALLQAGTLAAALAQARQRRPDLILLDLHLPDAHGADAIERLAADAATQGVPVVVVSADATRAQIERLLALGARDYLTKPIDLAALLATIDAQLGLSGSRD